MRAAIVKDGVAVNVVEYGPDSGWQPPEGELVPLGDDVRAGPGWSYDGETFTRPEPPAKSGPPAQTPEQKLKRWAKGVGLTLDEVREVLGAQ